MPYATIVRGQNRALILSEKWSIGGMSGQIESGCRGHRVLYQIALGQLQVPGAVVNLAANQAIFAVKGVQTITLREPMFERTVLSSERVAHRPVRRFEVGTRCVGVLAMR